MKKKKKEKVFFVKIIISSFTMLFLATVVYGADTIGEYIKTQTSTSKGSNNSKIIFSNKLTTYYINKDNDNSPIGDYLKGYYYDSKFGFFRLDWSDKKINNTRMIGNTDKCSSGNGYKFGGFAYSKYAGYIKFDYNSDIFVYYCENDNKLHGYGYSKHLGFQAFEGIGFKIGLIKTTTPEIKDDGSFVNDGKTIKNDDTHGINNWSHENIGGGDRYEIENAKIIEGAGLFENNKSLFRIIR